MGTADPGMRRRRITDCTSFSRSASMSLALDKDTQRSKARAAVRTSSSPRDHAVFTLRAQHLSKLETRLPWQFLGSPHQLQL